MRSLSDTSHEQHELIEPHVDRLPELAEMIGHVTPAVFSATFQEECSFIVGRLVPHMEAIETSLYGRLEEVMDKRHSMAPDAPGARAATSALRIALRVQRACRR